jgi:hypothetical protein
MELRKPHTIICHQNLHISPQISQLSAIICLPDMGSFFTMCEMNRRPEKNCVKSSVSRDQKALKYWQK